MQLSSTESVKLPGEGGLLQDCMKSWVPDRICLTVWRPESETEFQSLTFGDFLSLSRRTAGWMLDHGAKPGDVVILLIRDSRVLLSCFWAALLAGSVPAVLAYPNFKLNPEKYRFGLQGVTRNTGARLVIVDADFPKELRELIESGQEGCLVEINDQVVSGASPLVPGRQGDPDAPALLQHSAGTTGLQKGMALSHRQVLRQLRKLAAHMCLNRDDCFASWLPLYHDMGLISSFLLPLVAGLPLVLQSPDEWVMQPVSFLRIVSLFRATRAWLPNFAFAFMSTRIRPEQSRDLDLSSLQSLVNCSEPVTARALDDFYQAFRAQGLSREALETSFALAENVFAVTHSSPGEAPLRLAVDPASLIPGQRVRVVQGSDPHSVTVVSSGRCLAETEVEFLSEDGRLLEDGCVGEVGIQSDCLFSGYVRGPDLSRLLEHGYYRTGDLGFRWQGEVFVLGRGDDLLIIGGRNLYPTDIEDIVSDVQGIYEGRVVAFGVPSRKTGTQDLVIVAEVRSEEDVPEGTALTEIVRKRIVAETGVAPRVVELVPPRWVVKSSAGKPARSSNRKKFLQSHPELVQRYGWEGLEWSS